MRDELHRAAERLQVGVAHAIVVGEEDEIEFRPLGSPGDLDIVPEIDAGIRLRARVPPGRDVVAGRIEEGAEAHLALSAHRFRPN